jgi:hypothetical protein
MNLSIVNKLVSITLFLLSSIVIAKGLPVNPLYVELEQHGQLSFLEISKKEDVYIWKFTRGIEVTKKKISENQWLKFQITLRSFLRSKKEKLRDCSDRYRIKHTNAPIIKGCVKEKDFKLFFFDLHRFG